MTNPKWIPVFLAVWCATAANQASLAQNGNSVYSMFGIGRLAEHGFGINRTLGGAGIAFQSGLSTNMMNPASYLGILPRSLNLELGVYGTVSQSQNRKTIRTDGDVRLSDFSASLSLAKRWAFCFGIVPFSTVDYEIRSKGEIEGSLITLDKSFSGTGGLSRVFFGNAFELYRGLAFGFNASYVFGPITLTESAESNDSFSGYKLVNKRLAHGLYLDYGLQVSIRLGGWLSTLGAIYGNAREINTTDKRQFTYDETTVALNQDEQPTLRIPRKAGLGLAMKNGDRFRFGLDYEWKEWSAVRFTNPDLNVRDSRRYSAGVEFSPAPGGSGLGSLTYRLGGNFANSYLVIDKEPVNSMAVNVGVGIPSNLFNRVNLSLEYGEEGTLAGGLIKNRHWLVYFSYSIHQIISAGYR
jgi:hypothetical protein